MYTTRSPRSTPHTFKVIMVAAGLVCRTPLEKAIGKDPIGSIYLVNFLYVTSRIFQDKFQAWGKGAKMLVSGGMQYNPSGGGSMQH